jgi:hypothetical protein
VPHLADAPVVELRQYTLRPGRRDELVALFELRLLDPQVDEGMTIGGLFRDLDDPRRFVWQRGFTDMETRRRSLTAFYGGDTWRAHGPAANATMLDSDDVLLLRATEPPHPPAPAEEGGHGCVAIGVVGHQDDETIEKALAGIGYDALTAALEADVATWRTDPAANTFPALPVRDEHVFVWQATFPGLSALDAALGRLDRSPAWTTLRQEVDGWRENRLRLAPTPRSRHPRPRALLPGQRRPA